MGFLLALLAAVPMAASEPVQVVPVSPSVAWGGPQFVEADHRGRVFVLRGREFEVFPVDGDELGEPRRLFETPLEGGPPVTRAAMANSTEWAVRQGYQVRWFRSGKELPVADVGWPVWSIAMGKGGPVAAVVPAAMGPPAPGQSEMYPILMRLSGDEWVPLAEADAVTVKAMDRGPLMQAYAARIATDSQGNIWLGKQYGYEIRQYTSSGRELMTLTVDGGGISYREDEADSEVSAEARGRLDRARKRMAGDEEKGRVFVNNAKSVITALVEGIDGRQYFLVHAPGGEGKGDIVALDRYDAVRGVLERLPLGIDVTGGMSMASGNDGLYVAAFSGKGGRWRIPWVSLETAVWEPVEGVAVNGIEVEVPKAEAQNAD